MQQNVSIEFLNLPATDKYTFALGVINGITANAAVFPNLPITLTDLTAINDAYATALAEANGGSKLARAAFANAEVEWKNAYKTTAGYVNVVADGDVEIIRKANFNPTKGARQYAPLPGGCTKFEAFAPRETGTIETNCKSQGTHGYMYFAAPDGVTIEQSGNQIAITAGGITTYVLLCTRTKAQFKNMPCGKQLYVSALAFNATGAGPLTNGQQVTPQY